MTLKRLKQKYQTLKALSSKAQKFITSGALGNPNGKAAMVTIRGIR
jgi:hypothetical protein